MSSPRFSRKIQVWLLVLFFANLAACGGGGSKGTTSPVDRSVIASDTGLQVAEINHQNAKTLIHFTVKSIGVVGSIGSMALAANDPLDNCEQGQVVSSSKNTDATHVNSTVNFQHCLSNGNLLNGVITAANVNDAQTNQAISSNIEFSNFSIKAADNSVDLLASGTLKTTAEKTASSFTVTDNLTKRSLTTANYTINNAPTLVANGLPGSGDFDDSLYGRFQLSNSRLIGVNATITGKSSVLVQYGTDNYLNLALDENGDGIDESFARVAANSLDAVSNHLPPTVTILTQASAAIVGKPVQVDGSSSSDADGDFLSYSWTVSPANNVTLTTPQSPNCSFSAPAAGSYVVQLQISDGEYTRSAQKTILVQND